MTKRENGTGDPKAAAIRLDLNRRHTAAEVELVRYCFDCSEREARGILGARLTKERLAEARGMLDAMRAEKEEAEGRARPVPDWLVKARI